MIFQNLYINALLGKTEHFMRRTTKYFFVGMTLAVSYAIIFFSVSFLINTGSAQLSTIYVPKVNGAPNFATPNGPGSEPFWSTVQAHPVPLEQTVEYPGSPAGYTSSVTVKMAWANVSGTSELIILMMFANDGSGANWNGNQPVPIVNSTLQSYKGSNSPMYPNATVAEFCGINTNASNPRCQGVAYPGNTALPLAIGSSYIYPEQATVILGIAPGAGTDTWYQVSYKPKMVVGTSGALSTGTGGAAEMWTWASNPTDNSSQDTGYPGLKFPNGTSMDPSDFGMAKHASYAMDGYTNGSSYYQIGGMPNSSPFPFQNVAYLENSNASQIGPVVSAWNPFEVQAKSIYSSTANTWTVEFVRNLTTTSAMGESSLQEQLNPKAPYNYHIAFAVSQGQMSQTYLLYYNSVSFWWAFNFISPSGFNPSQYTATSTFAPFSGLILVFFIMSYLAQSTVPTSRKFVFGRFENFKPLLFFYNDGQP
jgi:hypothetical protein